MGLWSAMEGGKYVYIEREGEKAGEGRNRVGSTRTSFGLYPGYLKTIRLVPGGIVFSWPRDAAYIVIVKSTLSDT